MEREGATVTEQNIKAICSCYNVNETWLRTGEGEMLMESDRRQREFFEVFAELTPVLQDYLIQTARELLKVQAKLRLQYEKASESASAGPY